MNALKTKNEQLFPIEAAATAEKLSQGTFLTMIHEPYYPDTRKDVCLIKATIIDVQNSYDVLYLMWKNKKGMNHTKLWSTTAYDPPSERHLQIAYFAEDSKTLIAKTYPSSDPCRGHAAYPGSVYIINKDKLGI